VHFLIDACLPRDFTLLIESGGHLATDIRDMGMGRAEDTELENTRRKLQELEEQYAAATQRPIENNQVRQATLSSFRRLINQLKEEIIRFESRRAAPR